MRGSGVEPLDGYWLPERLRRSVLDDAAWETYRLHGGSLGDEAPEAVTVRRPRISRHGWQALLDGLAEGRAAGAREAVDRWQAVLGGVTRLLADEAASFMPALAAATGYSQEMLLAALGQDDFISAGSLAAALAFSPCCDAARSWQRLPGLPGWARFYPQQRAQRLRAALRPGAPLYRPAAATDLVLGFAAGNVPGTALLMALLAAVANHPLGDGARAPAVLIRNSRHEPLFAPWVLRAVEVVDPDLVAGLAVLQWDYEDTELQGALMARASLMIAAAGDDTIAALEAVRRRAAPRLRFHRHGHKASFAVVDTGAWQAVAPAPDEGVARLAALAALDSTLWEQNGCLSARVHFVAGDAAAYAGALAQAMGDLAAMLPPGPGQRRLVHRAFDGYAALEGIEPVRLHSGYHDDYAVVLDERRWQPDTFRRAVNACQGRVVVVRPVADAFEVPHLLRAFPAANLQSLSVAMGADRVLDFAAAAGARGVTAVRGLGRAAFPQPAYSWDGLLPLDMARLRPPGHFTTVEFDDLARELAATAARWGL